MKCMIIMKATADSEAGVMPSTAMLEAMGKFNEELEKAGLLLAGEGLHPSAKGFRVSFSGDKPPVVTDGPFAETKELIAGYWLWQVESREQALEWAQRIPNPDGGEFEVEFRPLFEAEDFGEDFTPELREREENLRQRLAEQQ